MTCNEKFILGARGFFPVVYVNFRRKQQEKKALAPRE